MQRFTNGVLNQVPFVTKKLTNDNKCGVEKRVFVLNYEHFFARVSDSPFFAHFRSIMFYIRQIDGAVDSFSVLRHFHYCV